MAADLKQPMLMEKMGGMKHNPHAPPPNFEPRKFAAQREAAMQASAAPAAHTQAVMGHAKGAKGQAGLSQKGSQAVPYSHQPGQ